MKISVFFDHILQAKEQTGKNLEELLKGVKKAGIQAVEIRLEYLLEQESVLEALKQADLGISCIYEFYEMGIRDETEKARKHIETAARVGAGRVLVVPGFLHGMEAKRMQWRMTKPQLLEKYMNQNEKLCNMVKGLTYMVDLGQQKGVTVTVEDFDDPKSPLSGMHGIHWFMKKVPGLGYTLDTGNYLYYGEEVLQAMELLKDRLAHVHCKDRHVGDNASVEAGTGYIPFGIVLQKLKEFNYGGYLAIEHFDVANQEGCMVRSAEFLSNLMD